MSFHLLFQICQRALVLLAFLTLTHNAHAADEHHHGHDAHEDEAHEHELGPHGGRLLHEGDVEVELKIFEQGVPPEFRAWITHAGAPVENAQLNVTLTRLGGERNSFSFARHEDYWLGDGIVNEPHSFDVAVQLKLHGQTHDWQWESHEGRVDIAPEMAEKVGIATVAAGPAQIERHLQVYGRLVTPPDQKVHLRARFPGVITDVRANVGDSVTKGDVLAIVESNESLQSYELSAPISGVVQQRSVNVGETATHSELFTLVNNDQLWAELKVFPSQRGPVQPGQDVHIEHNNHTHDTQITHLISTTDGSPYVLARATLHNENGDMAPGDLVSGLIDIERVQVPVAVDNRALQTFRDWTVVFIKVGNVYEARPLTLGRKDDLHTEVLEGLSPGDRYVVKNSYLIKADIEKSGASHHH